MDNAPHDTVLLQDTQLLNQHFLLDRRYRPFEIGKT